VHDAITDVPGVRVGHAAVPGGLSGTTVVLAPPDGAVAGVDVRGPRPARGRPTCSTPARPCSGCTPSCCPVAAPTGWRPPTG
jgi:L-aminopeptidase/D-esterase-like protein